MTNSSSPRLSGKVCIITGTGGSIGRAAAVAFAREGASVVGCDVAVAAAEATAETVRAQGGSMISVQPCRLTQSSECRALVDRAVREYGRRSEEHTSELQSHSDLVCRLLLEKKKKKNKKIDVEN